MGSILDKGVLIVEEQRSLLVSATQWCQHPPAEGMPIRDIAHVPAGEPSVRIYVSWSQSLQDRACVTVILKHLAGVRGWRIWEAGMVPPGANQDSTCGNELQSASLLVCLLSADYLTSPEYRRLKGSSRIDGAIPVLLRDVLVEDTPFHGQQFLPREGRALLSHNEREMDTAIVDVVRSIKQRTQLQVNAPTDWLQVYRGHVVGRSLEDISALMDASSRHCYEEALTLCDRRRDELEVLLRSDSGSSELREFVAVFRLITGSLRLSMQLVESAGEILDTVDDSVIPPEARCALAECLVQVDRIPRARALLLNDHSPVALQASQLIELVEGRVPADLQDVPSLHSRAALSLLWDQRLQEAVGHARRALEQAPEHPIIKANSVVVLITALIRSIDEDQDAINWLSRESCAEVVSLVDKELQGLLCEGRTPPLPPRLRRNVVLWAAGFADLTDDPVLLSGQDMEGMLRDVRAGEAGSLFSLPPVQRLTKALVLQDWGLLEEAVSALPEASPWDARLRRLKLAHQAGRAQEQTLLDEALSLERLFPGRAPLEYWAAKLLYAAGRYQEALQHARVAVQALPARWYRLFMVVCALRVGYLADAEKHLGELARSDLPPRILQTLRIGQAVVTELHDEKRARMLWKRYRQQQQAHLTRHPEDAPSRLDLACVHHRHGRFGEAARVAFAAVQRDPEAMLEAHELTLAIMLQQVDGQLDEERARRAHAMMEILRARHPGDEAANGWLVALETPRGRSDVDAAIERWAVLIVQAHEEPASLAAGVWTTILLEKAELLADGPEGHALDALLYRVLTYVAPSGKELALVPPGEARGLSRAKAESLWLHLDRWSAHYPLRRAAYRRAWRRLLCAIDMDAEPGAPDIYGFGQILVDVKGAPTVRAAVVVAPGEGVVDEQMILSLCLLSANWSEDALLRGLPALFKPGLDPDTTLRYGAGLLNSSAVEPGQRVRALDGGYWEYELPQGLKGKKKVTLLHLAEAVLLRASEDTIQRVAPVLGGALGSHDGRAYELLQRLAADPADAGARRRCARLGVLAPWRWIREDPAALLAWRAGSPQEDQGFPRTIAQLCRMLSEPSGPLLTDLPGEIRRRTQGDGAWAALPHCDQLQAEASWIPGSLCVQPAAKRLSLSGEAFSHEVESALDVLAYSDDHPSGRLAKEIVFLGQAAAHRPQVLLRGRAVNLRLHLPGRILSVLRTASGVKSRSCGARHKRRATLQGVALLEAPLLRICRRIVEDLDGPGVLTPRNVLWLTYRLFHWLYVQLANSDEDGSSACWEVLLSAAPAAFAGPVTDLLDPTHFDRELFDYRLSMVLYAVSQMERRDPAAPADAGPYRWPASMRRVLQELAGRPLSAHERRLSRLGEQSSCLGWEGPTSIPQIARLVLSRLQLDASPVAGR